MTETKPPTMKNIVVGCDESNMKPLFEYLEKLREVLLAHEKHAKEMLLKASKVKPFTRADDKRCVWWRGYLSAIQSLRGEKK